MYVCLCKGVSDSQIKQAVCKNGACTMRCLANQLGVATQCGKCGETAKQILKETLKEQAQLAQAEAESSLPLNGNWLPAT